MTMGAGTFNCCGQASLSTACSRLQSSQHCHISAATCGQLKCLCGVQDAIAEATADNKVIAKGSTARGTGSAPVFNLRADAHASPAAAPFQMPHDSDAPSAAVHDKDPAMTHRAAKQSSRTRYTAEELLALRAGCTALPPGAMALPAFIAITERNVDVDRAPLGAPTSRRAGVASGCDARGPSRVPRGDARPALGLRDAARKWLQLPRDLPGALPTACLTLFLYLPRMRCVQTRASCERCPLPTEARR